MTVLHESVLELAQVFGMPVRRIVGKDANEHRAWTCADLLGNTALAARSLTLKISFLLELPERGRNGLAVHAQFLRQLVHSGHRAAPASPLHLPANIRCDLF